MNSITHIIAHFFLLALGFGTQLLSPVVSTKLTGVGFYKLGTSIVLACLVLGAGVDYFMLPGLSTFEMTCYILLIVSNILGFAFHVDDKKWYMWTLYVFQIVVFTTLVFYSFQFNPQWIIFYSLSMALLSISNFSMILGHYYLVVPKLSEEPLIYCLYIFWGIMFIKLMSSLAILFSVADPFLVPGNQLGDGYMFNWLFISMRYLWGYAAPLTLSFFTYRLCKLRSLQSATGVLYIVEFFVIVGELISVYLMAKHGLAL
ncbi:MAG TPA: hypothetical protein VNJ08_11275 [Bacteriovoracaceae bacterium]|nr:hypothetical protein [Bacteriovoracaceae bacterium]